MNDKKEESLKTFNYQAKTYDVATYGEHARKLYPHILQAIIREPANQLLDLGCGTGELMKQVLLEDRNKHITGIDLSQNMLDMAKHKVKQKADFVLGDAEKLPFEDESFDLVYCNDSFHHYPHPLKVVDEINRVLKKDGIIIIGDCFQKGIMRMIMNFFMRFGHSGDVKMYSEKEMKEMLGKYFHNIQWKNVNHTSFIIKGVK